MMILHTSHARMCIQLHYKKVRALIRKVLALSENDGVGGDRLLMPRQPIIDVSMALKLTYWSYIQSKFLVSNL